MPLVPGTRLGPYEVIASLGAGGMGEVYRARDTRLDRDVALKVLRSDFEAGPDPPAFPDAQGRPGAGRGGAGPSPGASSRDDRLARFEREAKAVAALNHPHILTVHDVGVHEGAPYIVTELLEGVTLRQVAAYRTPTLRQVLGWACRRRRGWRPPT